MIRWFARNDIASNLLILAILLAGAYSALHRVPLEVQPAVEYTRVDIRVAYRGGNPADVEKAVVIPIESALEGLMGVDSMLCRARSNGAQITVDIKPGVDPKDIEEEIRSRIDTITTFPPEIDPPKIYVPDSRKWFDVIKIAVAGDMDEEDLIRAARRVRDDFIAMPEISQANIQGISPMEISIEADPARLRDFGLTFQDLSNAIQRSSVDLPAGRIHTDEGSLMIRSKGQAYSREDFENIVITNQNGSEVLLGNVANVGDGFQEERKTLRFNGVPCLLVEALRLDDENALKIAAKVKSYAASANERFPEGITLHVWDDSSIELEGRLGTLTGSLLQGGLLVMIVLGLFLRPAIAFWVTLGIPVAFAGGFIFMPFFGITSNVMSIFGFIIVIGIIVDDAIVTAENVYIKLREGLPPLDAATEGTREVSVPVTFGVLTTIFAFLPLMVFDGFYGSFTKQIPPVVGAVLVFSLIESKFILPSHLKHVRVHRKRFNSIERVQKKIADSLEKFVKKIYEPSLRFTTRHRYTTLAAFTAIALAAFGYMKSGALGFVNMPSVDRNRIIAQVRLPRETPVSVTDTYVLRIADKVEQLKKEFTDPATGQSIITGMMSSTGGWSGRDDVDSDTGFVVLSILDPGFRSEPGPKNSEIAKRWTELVGELPHVRSFWISGDKGGGFNDDELESLTIELRGPTTEEKAQLAEDIESLLESYDGIADAWSDSGRTRDELVITIRPEGEALGLTQRDLANQVRAAFFGVEAQRVQRDRDNLRVMVRLPREHRSSLSTLDSLRIKTPSGGEAPFHSVAKLTFTEARSDITRIDGAQILSVSAKPEDEGVNIVNISRNLAPKINAMISDHPELTWRYTGYVAEHEETKTRVIFGSIALFLGLYALLAIPFKSIYQPFFVMLAVPFGAIGAIIGHVLMDITPSYLSVFGILALAGVVVNDSLVMVDFINQRIRAGDNLFESVIHSGTRRFRPIFLTSATTFAGLIPILLDRSLQAQFLIPMACSLAFGIVFATTITLYLIPSAFVAAEEIKALIIKSWGWYMKPFKHNDAE